MNKLANIKQPLALLPHLKPKSLNDNTMYTIQVIRKTIQSFTSKYAEPSPMEMATKQLRPQKVRKQQGSKAMERSISQHNTSFEINQVTQSTNTIPIRFQSLDKQRTSKSPNFPINSQSIFRRQRSRGQILVVADRYHNLKKKALSLNYGQRARSVLK